MHFLEDSGIESEDKSSVVADEHDLNYITRNNTEKNADDLKVTFSGPDSIGSKLQPSPAPPIKLSSDPDYFLKPPNTCRILQRKLELKVERAKRNYSHYKETNGKKTQSESLIPINKLSIPGDLEKKPLVDYKSESDDCEDISFFPNHHYKGQSKMQAELSDNFSIQEMAIDSDLESNDSQNLELLSPHTKNNCLDYLAVCFCFQSSS